MKALVSAALMSLALAAPAFASQCPSDIAKIDGALQGANLSAAQKEQVMQLRNEGERLHQSGQHADSVKTLAQAKEILGIN